MMRKFIAALLTAATLTTPALAQRRDADAGFQPARERTVEQHAARPAPQAARQQSRPAAQAPRQQFRQEQRADRQAFRQERRDDRQQFRQERQGDRQAWQNGQYINREQFRRDRADDIRDFRRDRADDRRDFRQDRQQDRRDWQRDRNQWQNNQWQNNQWQNRDRDGSRWNTGGRNNGSWNREWRRDPRYNWQNWRQRNRGSYNFPRYYAPRGWSHGYNRFSLGVILSAPLFTQNYWIDDPYQYSLPPAYGPYRWVRYYDDALLVDIRTGQVVDAIYDFFW